MCKWDTIEKVYVRIPADLACSGKSYWKSMLIDKCIAPIVKALQEAGIDMRGSCCGHGNRPGIISLADGRELFVLPDYDAARKLDSKYPNIWGENGPKEQ